MDLIGGPNAEEINWTIKFAHFVDEFREKFECQNYVRNSDFFEFVIEYAKFLKQDGAKPPWT